MGKNCDILEANSALTDLKYNIYFITVMTHTVKNIQTIET